MTADAISAGASVVTTALAAWALFAWRGQKKYDAALSIMQDVYWFADRVVVARQIARVSARNASSIKMTEAESVLTYYRDDAWPAIDDAVGKVVRAKVLARAVFGEEAAETLTPFGMARYTMRLTLRILELGKPEATAFALAVLAAPATDETEDHFARERQAEVTAAEAMFLGHLRRPSPWERIVRWWALRQK